MDVFEVGYGFERPLKTYYLTVWFPVQLCSEMELQAAILVSLKVVYFTSRSS